MSVVVRMEMPTERTTCELNYYPNFYHEWRCIIADKRCDHNKNGKFPSWCPIICQLPDGHGRLVDADALYKIAWPVKDHTGRIEECVQMRDLYKAPTIVPAERSE